MLQVVRGTPLLCSAARRGVTTVTPPLAGIRVLELASVLAGPSVGQFLAELGADVVKVENRRTKGDVTRGWRLPKDPSNGITAYFSCCNLGKKSIALDAGTAEGQALCKKLAAKSDVVIASYKPGDAEKFGLDAASLRDGNPSLIYAQITGYGLDDPRVGYDALIQAEAGFTFMNGEPGTAGVPTKMPVALVDLLAAHQLKEAILLAFLQRERSGQGAHVHVSLMSAAVASLANQATGWLLAEKIPQRMGSDHPSICPYGTVFQDKDGNPLVLAVGADSQFRTLCEILGRPDLPDDPRYTKNADRVKHRDEVKSLMAELISKCDRRELLDKLAARKVPGGAIADMSTVFETPQAQDLVIRSGVAADAPAMGLSQIAWRGDHATDVKPKQPPRYGEHTRDVLVDFLGLQAGEVEELLAQGVVEAPTSE